MTLIRATIVLLLAAAALSGQTESSPHSIAPSQSEPAAKPPEQQPKPAKPRDPEEVRRWLFQKWRKYGEWDYKQQGSKYRQFTNFNFGTTGSAAGFTKEALIALSNMSNPSQEDILSLDDPELLAGFARNAEQLEKLRVLADEDSRFIRIAKDYTEPHGTSKVPEKNPHLSQTRWDEYRSLFDSLGLAEGIVRTEDYPGAVFLIARSKGLCTGGTSAGYVYSTVALSPVVDSPGEALVEVTRKNSRNEGAYYVFKSLRANWYAFYEADW